MLTNATLFLVRLIVVVLLAIAGRELALRWNDQHAQPPASSADRTLG